jgi:hypothetical protein
LNLTLQPPESKENKCLLFVPISLQYVIMAAQAAMMDRWMGARWGGEGKGGGEWGGSSMGANQALMS